MGTKTNLIIDLPRQKELLQIMSSGFTNLIVFHSVF